jgi:hypothetical protein
MADGLDVEPMWEADLIEGVVVDRSGTSHNVHDQFGGSTFDAILPDGTIIPNEDGGLGDVVRGQKFSTAPESAVRAAILSSLRDVGLTPKAVSVLRPWGPAPAVVASTADPAATLKQLGSIERTLFGDPPTYEGYYFELQDGSGQTIVRASSSFRTGVGRFWIDPKWRGASDVVSGGTPLESQP